MANINTIQVTGKGPLDLAKRTEALNALSKEATTAELVKLQKAIKDPALRSMLDMV